jgi:hypothetical protein
MMDIRMPETCWAVFKRQIINLRNCCIWLVDSFECMMMHGPANPKFMVGDVSQSHRVCGYWPDFPGWWYDPVTNFSEKGTNPRFWDTAHYIFVDGLTPVYKALKLHTADISEPMLSYWQCHWITVIKHTTHIQDVRNLGFHWQRNFGFHDGGPEILLKNGTFNNYLIVFCGPGSSVGIATGYGLDGPGIESRWGERFFAPVQTGPGAHPACCKMGTGSSPVVKSGRGVTLTPHPFLVPLVMKE